MARRVIDRLRDRIRAGDYVVPFHAANELDDDEITLFDVENIVLTGEIIERQRDAQISPTGTLVIITAWVEEGGHAM